MLDTLENYSTRFGITAASVVALAKKCNALTFFHDGRTFIDFDTAMQEFKRQHAPIRPNKLPRSDPYKIVARKLLRDKQLSYRALSQYVSSRSVTTEKLREILDFMAREGYIALEAGLPAGSTMIIAKKLPKTLDV